MNTTKTRLGRLEARQPVSMSVAVVATRADAHNVVEEAQNAGRPPPTVILTGVSRGPDTGPTWLSWGKVPDIAHAHS